MLTARIGTLRDWALFAAAALTPAVAVGALGLRALAHEEDAARREVAITLTAAASTLTSDIDRTVARATRDLEAAALDDPARVASTLDNVAPRFSTAVVLGADRSLVLPSPPAASERVPSSAKSLQRCRALAAEVASHAGTESLPARRELLASCLELSSPSGRLLWPVVALDPASAGLVSQDDIATWVEAHAARLSEAERAATRVEADRAMTDEPKARMDRALSVSWSRRDAIAAALGTPSASAAFHAPAGPGLVTWRGGGAIGALKLLPDGRFAGFVVEASAISDALASGGFALPSMVRARVSDAARSGSDLSADATIAPGLTVRVSPSDPGAVARLASRSRALLAALGAFGILAAFALAAALFARMRAARRSGALRTDFVAAVSHELRTPIASMRMLAELLDEGRLEPDEQPEVFHALAREARRLGDTVERLLSFSRMSAGRHAIERAEARVAAVVGAAVDTFEERYPDVPKVVRAFDSEAVADIDVAQVQLAVDNLLGNARKYAPQGTPYVVHVAREAGAVTITVSDRGPGIARRDRARIFEPFERADDRLSRATEGTGIGLSLVRHVARAHGGEVTVVSEVGGGAAFTVSLPAAESGR